MEEEEREEEIAEREAEEEAEVEFEFEFEEFEASGCTGTILNVCFLQEDGMKRWKSEVFGTTATEGCPLPKEGKAARRGFDEMGRKHSFWCLG